jgi:hypothetical protein
MRLVQLCGSLADGGSVAVAGSAEQIAGAIQREINLALDPGQRADIYRVRIHHTLKPATEPLSSLASSESSPMDTAV